LQSLVERYPLYSRADEAEYMLGQNYEGQMARIRMTPTCDVHNLPRGCTTEAVKARWLDEFTKEAAQAYGRIITRYPLMDRADDARKRLAALHQPIPRPTKAAVAQNRAELASRTESTTVQKLMGLVKKGPDVAQAAKVGEPNLVEQTPVAAKDVLSRETLAAAGMSANDTVGVSIINPNQPAATTPPAAATPPGGSPFGNSPAATTPPATPDPNELKPNAPTDPNELKPVDSGSDQALPPPPQINEIRQGQSSSSSATASNDSSAPATDEDLSSSKKKKKKGLKKLVPF